MGTPQAKPPKPVILSRNINDRILKPKITDGSAQVAYTTPPTDVMRAYVWFPLFTVPDGLKEFPVYRALMMATAVISLVLTGYYGARSSK